MKLDENQRTKIVVSFENFRLKGTLDEYVNSNPLVGLKEICDKRLKADDIVVDEVITEAKHGDFVPQESAGSNSKSKKKSKASKTKLIRESEQLDGISNYGLAKLYQTPLGKAQQKMN